jgi:hypothetical protein
MRRLLLLAAVTLIPLASLAQKPTPPTKAPAEDPVAAQLRELHEQGQRAEDAAAARLRELREQSQRQEDGLVAVRHDLAPHGYLVSVRHQVRGSKQHDEMKSSSNNYSDDRISCLWIVDAKRALFILTNKTEETMAIRWSGISWIDTSSTSHRVMHEGVRFVDRSAGAPDSIVAPDAGITDFLVPSDAVELIDGKWSTSPLLTSGDIARSPPLRVLMPVVIGVEIHDYIFTFAIRADEKDLANARAEDAKAAPVKP